MSGPVLNDSRRLTGPNLLTPGPGAIIDVRTGDVAPAAVIDRWRIHVRRILDAVGWSDQEIFARAFTGGASLAFSAPIDVLYAATEVNEWALEATLADLQGAPVPDVDEGAARLTEVIADEANPRLVELERAAGAHGVTFIWDDDHVSVGMGRGSVTWPAKDLPSPEDVDWEASFDVPVALVTGSNGKTTTIRLLAAIAAAAGRTPGFSSTDGVFVGDTVLDGGDYSGPGGARAVLRDQRVDVALLETARGGLLRRGLGVPRADAAVVTNIAMDHFGEYGVDGLEDIASAKLVVARALQSIDHLFLNIEDPTLAARYAHHREQPGWYAVHPTGQRVSACVEDGELCLYEGNQRHVIVAVGDVPVTLDGAAEHNVSNALAAACAARRLGFSLEEVKAGLMGFVPDEHNSPGRTNVYQAHGVTIVVDFAHNPEGMDALVATAQRMPSERRLLIIGQAGDRDDESIRAIARSAARLDPDRVVIKEMEKLLRGREPGVIPDIIEKELRSAGVQETVRARSEIEAVNLALEWARPGDLLVLPTHESRTEVIARVHQFAEASPIN